MGKAAEKKLLKRAALMKSAYDLFTTEGFTNTTIGDITARAGVAKGTFYLYFTDKADIREAVIRSTADTLLRRSCERLALYREETGEHQEAADIFIYIINDIIDEVSGDPYLLRFLSKHLSWGLFTSASSASASGASMAGRDSSSCNPVLIEEYIVEKLDKNNIRIRDLRLLLFTLLELVSSTCYDVILYQQPVMLEQYKPYLNNCIRLLVNAAVEE